MSYKCNITLAARQRQQFSSSGQPEVPHGEEMKKSDITELLSYGFWGFMTTAISIGVFFFLSGYCHWPYLVANVAALILSNICAFFANKYFVFQSKSFHLPVLLKECSHFFGVRLLNSLLDMGAMYLLVSILGVNAKLAKILVSIVVIALNYLFNKLWVFCK